MVWRGHRRSHRSGDTYARPPLLPLTTTTTHTIYAVLLDVGRHLAPGPLPDDLGAYSASRGPVASRPIPALPPPYYRCTGANCNLCLPPGALHSASSLASSGNVAIVVGPRQLTGLLDIFISQFVAPLANRARHNTYPHLYLPYLFTLDRVC